ncbi:DUF1800 family protein [Tenacibaculum jejuense]|uniref:DUF1800 domain-containing protein n=1 Tax=Tenacibaculum jejuense TaxID=584609 RepID=A0A238UG80_9FLAO|nr:DUF1800 family protein [Tenacibaculum jejuense]SNR17370.1 Protein of unknown function [Tenacibaculum jejuense]
MNYLDQYSGPLGLRKAKHLLRRTSFNYSKETLQQFATLTPEAAFNQLITNQNNLWSEPYDPRPETAPDGNWTSSTEHPNTFDGHFRKRRIITSWWWYNGMNQNSLIQKMTFFLHTSFTVSKDDGAGFSTNFYDHLLLLEKYALGNLKTLSKKITFDNSMLDFLDNTQNNANNPNENYAREFLELFTILKAEQIGNGDYTNYTELDVQQAAKVFSGIKIQTDRSIIDAETNIPKGRIDVNRHDQDNKTFSHAFDNTTIIGSDTEIGIVQELSDFVEMVFSKEATAISFIRKLYRYFVKSEWNDTVEENVIKPLATELKDGDYEILPILKKLLTSNHFYDLDDTNADDNIIGSIIKSPLQLINEVISFFKMKIPDPATEVEDFYQFFNFVHNIYLAAGGMLLWSPDSVAGYPAHYQSPDFDRHWFSSNTVLARYKLIESLLTGRNKIRFNNNIRVELNIVDFIDNNITEPLLARELITELASFLYPEDISDERVTYFAQNLLEGFPDYYWTDAWIQYKSSGDDTIVKTRLHALIIQMINAPEFQLM